MPPSRLAPSSTNGTASAAVCPCGGRIEPRTDGSGGLVDRCVRCNAKRGEGRAPAGSVSGARCRVDGCPGTLDGAGRCACCVKRAAWADEHIPKRTCAICAGPIEGNGNVRYCEACKPIAAKAKVAGWRADQRASSSAKKKA